MNLLRIPKPNKPLRQLLVVLLFGILFFSFALFTVPIHAQTTGLVTCGLQHGTGTETAFCTICDLIVLIQNIMNKAMYIFAAPIAAFMLGYGGFLMVWAGVKGGDSGMMKKGKDIMTNSIIGIVIIFSSWLLIDTLMKGLGAYQYATSPNFGPWNKIECQAPPISLPKHMGCNGDTCEMVEGSGSATCSEDANCGDQAQHLGCDKDQQCSYLDGTGTNNCEEGDDPKCVKKAEDICKGVECKDSNIDTYKPNLAADCSIKGDWDKAITAGIKRAGNIGGGIDMVKMVKAIMATESHGNISQPSPAGACGLMQTLPDTGRRYASLCGASFQEASTCDFYKKAVNAEASVCIAVKIMIAAGDGNCGKSVHNIAGGYNGGQGACNASVDCGSQAGTGQCRVSPDQVGETKRWECLYEDSGHTKCNADKTDGNFMETRKYVPNVLNCYNKL